MNAAHAPRSLLVRADASEQIGTGHVMRCLALADRWRRTGNEVIFLMSRAHSAIVERVTEAGFTCEGIDVTPGGASDAAHTAKLAAGAGAAWVMVDGYHFDAGFQSALKEAGHRILFVDDYGHATHYPADLVLNQNLTADSALYASRAVHTRLLLGPKYALLRAEFLRARAAGRITRDRAQKILVSFGGSDPNNVTELALDALALLPGSELRPMLIIGGSNPNRARLLARAGRDQLDCATNVQDLATHIAGSDLALAAAGTTAWEFACLGLPALLITISDNQAENAVRLAEAGVARALGWHTKLDAARIAAEVHALAGDAAARAELSRRGRALVDGDGAFRVWLEMNQDLIRFRDASQDDAKRLFDWANQPEVREASFLSRPISWEEHVAWFEAKLATPGCRFWIAELAGGEAVAPVRFELADDHAVISVSVAAAARGRGLGSLIIDAACKRLFDSEAGARTARILAHIKPANEASLRAFSRAAFTLRGETRILEQPALVHERVRSDGGRTSSPKSL